MRDQLEFFRQFRQRFETTGSITPSSRFLARAMTGPMSRAPHPLRILEVGPGTGPVTRRIVRLLQPGDRFDLVEINDRFAALLEERFRTDPHFIRVAEQSQVHCCPLQEFASDEKYDFIISGLPLANFPIDMIEELLEAMFRRLKPGGVLSYFEYMFIRPLRRRFSTSKDRAKFRVYDDLVGRHFRERRINRSWVFVNFPPAWVQHLRAPLETSPATDPEFSSGTP